MANDDAGREGGRGPNKASGRRCLHDVLVRVVLPDDSRGDSLSLSLSPRGPRYELIGLIAAANDTDAIKSRRTPSSPLADSFSSAAAPSCTKGGP